MGPSFKFLNKLLDALPNIKKIRISIDENFKNLPAFLKTISGMKNLKSLKVAIYGQRDPDENFGHILEIRDSCNIIKNNFRMNTEVFIAEKAHFSGYLTNLIEKNAGEYPKIVNGLSEF